MSALLIWLGRLLHAFGCEGGLKHQAEIEEQGKMILYYCMKILEFGTVKFFVICISLYPKLKLIKNTRNSGYYFYFALIIFMKRRVRSYIQIRRDTIRENLGDLTSFQNTRPDHAIFISHTYHFTQNELVLSTCLYHFPMLCSMFLIHGLKRRKI